MEAIQDEESRDFNTTIGQWQGPLTWDAPPWSWYGGAGKITLPGNGVEVEISLAYPTLLLENPKSGEIRIACAFDTPGTDLYVTALLTDGVTTFNANPFHLTSDYWKYFDVCVILADFPEHWDTQNTIWKVSLSTPGPDPVPAWVDVARANYSQYQPPEPTQKPQHLPVMGIG